MIFFRENRVRSVGNVNILKEKEEKELFKCIVCN